MIDGASAVPRVIGARLLPRLLKRGGAPLGCTRGSLAASLVVCALISLCALVACSSEVRHSTVEVAFISQQGAASPSFRVEVVSTPSTRAQGLMFRRELGERQGMIFIFPYEKVQSFWMKNTLIPLDMVFVSKEMKVVGILENVPPLTEDPRFVEHPSSIVLEFAGGTMKRFGVVPGARLEIRGELPRPL